MGLFSFGKKKKRVSESAEARNERQKDVTGENRRIRKLIKVSPKSPMGVRNQRYKEAADY
jgi:hypothetical protein